MGAGGDDIDRPEEPAPPVGEQGYRLLFDANPLPMWVYDTETLAFLAVNDTAVLHYGYSRDEFLAMTIADIRRPEEVPALLENVATTFAVIDRSSQARHRTRDGRFIDVEITSHELTFGGRRARLVLAHDVTERRAAEASLLRSQEALRSSEERFRSLVQHAADAIVVVDADGHLAYASPAIEHIVGYTPEEVAGIEGVALVHPDDVEYGGQRYADALSKPGDHPSFEHRVLHRDGSTVYVHVAMTNLLDDPDVHGLVLNIRDVTERRRVETELAHQALHDPLTDLPNRSLFLDRLTVALARSVRQRTHVAVLFLDLDRFKMVNDSLGHEAGDRLLVAASERLRRILRPSDTVARFGGDEFAVLCDDIGEERSALMLAERVVSSFAEPFELERQEVFVTASIGIALDRDGQHSPEALLRDADAAMYRAKERGRSCYEVFDDAMRWRAVRWLETESALRRALERRELVLHYQPTVALADGRITSFEALLRWPDPRPGPITTAQLIALAEETGLIVPIGALVLEEACLQARAWAEEADRRTSPSVAVNVSARQLARSDLLDMVAGVLARTGVDPSLVCLEITESVLMDDAESSLATLNALRSLGVGLAIDDFGTGYSSLTYLKRFPVDVLKIDQSFVAGLGQDASDEAIVRAVIGLARAKGVTVIAEGVERDDQLAMLQSLGCDAAQGYRFARPVAALGATELLRGGSLLVRSP